MRSLEEVLKELKDAEKEYQEKCLKYGIQEKVKRKPKTEEGQVDPNTVNENNEEVVASTAEETSNIENTPENK